MSGGAREAAADGSFFMLMGNDRRTKLTALAKEEGRSASEIVRALVDGYLLLNGVEPGRPIAKRGRPPGPRRSRE